MRVGIGHDTHRLVEGRPLILGGVRIEHQFGLSGHSDADVVMHAVADALLGAAGLGDIGERYPDTDPRWEGLDGGELLGDVVGLVSRAGWRPVNCDVIVHAQAPKIAPYKKQMEANLAGLIGLDAAAVNVKAKTGEHVGPIGRGEAIACEAVVLLDADERRRGSPRSPLNRAAAPPSQMPMPLRIYNTLTQAKEPFRPLHPPKVGMYVCGPTVYSRSHVGHMVGPVIFDTIKRYLTYRGYEVTWVVNITDVDDKLIVQANKEGTTVKELAERVTADYLDCLAALGVEVGPGGIDHLPRATEYIVEIVAMTEGLIAKGFAYASKGDVYFDVTRAPEYGKLSHRDPEELQAGGADRADRREASPRRLRPLEGLQARRAVVGEPLGARPPRLAHRVLRHEHEAPGRTLRHPRRRPRPGLPPPRERGRPVGVVQRQALRDLLAAQRPPDQGRQEDLQERPGHDHPDGRPAPGPRPRHPARPPAVEPLSPPDRLRPLAARRDRQGLADLPHTSSSGPGGSRARTITPSTPRPASRASIPRSPPPTRCCELRRRFLDAMDDDFNTGGALGELFELVRSLNRHADAKKLDANAEPAAVATFRAGVVVLKELTQILGLFRKEAAGPEPEEDRLTAPLLDLLVELRTLARKDKNFKLGDEIRGRLAALGVVLEDRPDGTRWKVEG